MSAIKEFLFNNEYAFLLQIAIILLATKLLGLLTKRISLPQVVGALAAGIILGPMLLDVVERNDLIVNLAELGLPPLSSPCWVLLYRWWAASSWQMPLMWIRIRKWHLCSGRIFSSALF